MTYLTDSFSTTNGFSFSYTHVTILITNYRGEWFPLMIIRSYFKACCLSLCLGYLAGENDVSLIYSPNKFVAQYYLLEFGLNWF